MIDEAPIIGASVKAVNVRPQLLPIVITGYASKDAAVEALKEVIYYVHKAGLDSANETLRYDDSWVANGQQFDTLSELQSNACISYTQIFEQKRSNHFK